MTKIALLDCGDLDYEKAVRIYKKQNSDEVVLHKKYSPEEYPKYDNYDAINVDRTEDIPKDYYGAIGVPITFLEKYNEDDWELLDILRPKLDGKYLYRRIIIRRKA